MKKFLKYLGILSGVCLLLIAIDFMYVKFKGSTPVFAIHEKDTNVYRAFFYKVWSCKNETYIGSYPDSYECSKNETTSNVENENALRKLFDKDYFKETVINSLIESSKNMENEPKIVPEKLTFFKVYNIDLIKNEKQELIFLYDAEYSCDDQLWNSCLYFSQFGTGETKKDIFQFRGMAFFTYNETTKSYDITNATTSSAGDTAIIYDLK